VNAAAIESVVRERLGVDPQSLGPDVLAAAVRERLRALRTTDPALYAVRLMTDGTEQDALAVELSVPETWFFRGGRPLFEKLAGFLAERTVGRGAGNRVRALSVPCSTGEEPYSLSIALHERFLTPTDYQIDAVDISPRALDRALAARYGSFAFRDTGVDVRPVYFRQTEGQWELLPHLRAGVRLRPGSLTDPNFLAGERPYDLILCRNLFIYFTDTGRQRALANLDRLLAIDGRLCLSPAEADKLPSGRFVPDGPAEFGVYKRLGTSSSVYRALATRPVVAPVPPAPSAAPGADLAAARALADSGKLDEALAACAQVLKARPTDADALALLGVLHLAAGRTADAADALRKALYLVPDHVEATEHMIAVCERRGDRDRAAVFRAKLARANRKGGTP
jgi:chemotaxis protein methyltransferase WspC